MKKGIYILAVILASTLLSCELQPEVDDIESPDENTTSVLSVVFTNNSDSEYTISSIQTLVMEEAGGEMQDPDGDFSENYLSDGEVIEPGNSYSFEIEMPNLYYSYCKLGVIDENGNTLILTEQENYPNQSEGTITYWGSDKRQVNVTLVKDEYSGIIRPTSWGEWAD